LTEQQWMTVYRETAHSLYGYVARRTSGNRALTEDIVQETLLRALGDWRKETIPDSPLAWLRRVAQRILIDYLRRSKRAREVALRPDFEAADPAAETVFGSLDPVLAISSLGRKKARVMEAFYFDGLGNREISAEMGISERAVEGLLRRARQSLKGRLPESKPQGGYHEQGV
jgi:RNA polymerase sigma-70 factor (ECF subfamily)